MIFPEGISIIPQEAFGNATTADGGTLNLVFLGEMSGNTMLNGNDYRTWAAQVIIYFAKNSLSDYSATLYSVGTDGSLTQGQAQTGSFWIKPSNGAPTNTSKIPEKALMLVFCKNATPEISYMLNNAGTAITEATTYSNNEAITANVIAHTKTSENHIYTMENKDCSDTGTCIICESANQFAHTDGEIISIVYKNGFLSQGDMIYSCSACGNKYSKENVTDPLFTCLGYSFFEGSDGGITMGYKIDNDAIKFYESKTNNKLSYGLYVAVYDSLGENAILNEDGTPSNGVLKIDIENNAYSKVTVKITGIKTEEQKATKLLLGAYVVDENEEETKISYLEYGIKDEGGKYSYVTYNYIAQNTVI